MSTDGQGDLPELFRCLSVTEMMIVGELFLKSYGHGVTFLSRGIL